MVPLFLLLLVSGGGSLFGQTSFDDWKEEQDGQFQTFLSDEDAAFSAFLEEEWEAFQAHLSESFYSEPKLEDPPTVDSVSRERTGREERMLPVPPPKAERNSSRVTERRIELAFHGVEIELELPGEVEGLSLKERSPTGFSDYWEAAATSQTKNLVSALQAKAEEHSFNDYTYFRLVVSLTALIYANPVDAAAATWFTMVASGYDMRIAYSSSQLALLLPSSHNLYGVSFFSGDNRRYYLLNPDGSAVRSGGGWRTYRGNHSNATKSVALTLPPVLNVPELVRNEEFEFTYRGEQFTIQVPINQHVVNLLEDYPFTDWYVHFSLPVSRSARQAVANQFGEIVRGRSPSEAANIIIRFVQTAFPYQTDQEHFGYEKWQSPEEIFYYRYSDCDDRSVLYAYLLEEVLGWDDVAVLNYPGHLAIAVPQARLGIEGDSVMHNGVRYIVTDPTYIGADIGRAMPQFRNVTPEVNVIREGR